MKNILVVMKKQFKDTFKNLAVLMQFILLPAFGVLLTKFVHPENFDPLYFTKMFSVVYMGVAPLQVMAAIISEEKEKNTLRVLMMSNVKPWQYLIGIGTYVWTLCMAGAASFIFCGMDREDFPFYMLVMGIGFIITIFVGACIGIFAKNQMASTSIATVLMIAIGFMPMLATFNEKIGKVAKFLYTQQIRLSLDGMSLSEIKSDSMVILLVNAVLAVVLFFVLFRKKGLE